jgi:hypothetical protein
LATFLEMPLTDLKSVVQKDLGVESLALRQ